MRWAILLVLAASPLFGQLSRIEVVFEDTGCASCLESLEARLVRVRDVDRVEMIAQGNAGENIGGNIGGNIVKLHLTPNNRIRLTPLLSRITQDGAKILRTRVQGRGVIVTDEQGYRFEPTNSVQTYRLRLKDTTAKPPQPGILYEVAGQVSDTEPGHDPVLTADSITP